MGTELLKIHANERMDLTDLDFAFDDSFQSNLDQLNAQMLTDPNKTAKMWIIDGFGITNPAGSQVQIAKGRALLGKREGSVVTYGALASAGDATKTVDVSGFAGPNTYNIYIRFEYVGASSQSRVFWNPAGNGSEFSQTVETRRAANWSMRIELTTPGAEWVKIGEVDVDGGAPAAAITALTDKRPFYFEGEANWNVLGAVSLGNEYQSGWSTDGGGGANDRNADRKTYGAKDLQTSIAALRQSIEDIKGRGLKNWWDRDIGGMNIGFDANPTSGRLSVADAQFYLHLTGGVDPEIAVDSNDYVQFDRDGGSSNLGIWKWFINSAEILRFGENAGTGVSINNGLYVGSALGSPFNDDVVVEGGMNVGFVADPVADRIAAGSATCFLDGTPAAESFQLDASNAWTLTGLTTSGAITATGSNVIAGGDFFAASGGINCGGAVNPSAGHAIFTGGLRVGSDAAATADDIYADGGLNIGGTTDPTAGKGIFTGGLSVGFDLNASLGGNVQVGDTDFGLGLAGVVPQLYFDAGDRFEYARSGGTPNQFRWVIGNTTRLNLNTTQFYPETGGAINCGLDTNHFNQFFGNAGYFQSNLSIPTGNGTFTPTSQVSLNNICVVNGDGDSAGGAKSGVSSWNLSTITRNSVGSYTINILNSLLSREGPAQATCYTSNRLAYIFAKSQTTISLNITNVTTGSLTDDSFSFAMYGGGNE